MAAPAPDYLSERVSKDKPLYISALKLERRAGVLRSTTGDYPCGSLNRRGDEQQSADQSKERTRVQQKLPVATSEPLRPHRTGDADVPGPLQRDLPTIRRSILGVLTLPSYSRPPATSGRGPRGRGIL